MKDGQTFLVVSFPSRNDQLLYWWYIEDGIVSSRGHDLDPALAAGLDQIENGPIHCIALIASEAFVQRWHLPLAEANENQALAIALREAKNDSLASEQLHVTGALMKNGGIVTASTDHKTMIDGITFLQERGLDPDSILPASSPFLVDGVDVISVDLGFDKLLIGENFVAPDEPAFRASFLEAEKVVELEPLEVNQNLALAYQAQELNFRSGAFAKKQNQKMAAEQKRLLFWLAAALVIVSLVIPTFQLIRYQSAISDANKRALATARPIVGDAESLEAADRLLNERLIAQSKGNIAFSVPGSALLSALQQAAGVSVTRLSYQQNGVVSAELTAVRNEDINPVLLAIQQAGFKVTATPRVDATGSAKADITVRAP